MSFFEFLKGSAVAVSVGAAFALLSGAAFERMTRDRVAREYPAPGAMVNGVQLDCRGAGSPTVVFESGLDTFGSLSWTSVHDSVARTTRACAWSRPGIMWSRVTPGSARQTRFDVDTNASMLHAALVAAGEAGPWLMVGHSLGGPYAMVFASRYRDETAGLVMVDPSHPDQFERYRAATGKWLMPSASPARLGERLAWTGIVRRVGAGASPATWPKVVREVPPKFLPVSVGALADETEAIPATLARMRQSNALGDLPLVVLQAGNGPSADELRMMKLTAEQGTAMAAIRRELLAGMAAWSTRGRLEVVGRSGHYIQLDRPDAVIAAINAVLTDR